MPYLRALKSLLFFVAAGLTSCANYSVIYVSNHQTPTIPSESLSIALKQVGAHIRVVKQERGVFSKPSVTEKEHDTFGPIAARSAQIVYYGIVPQLQTVLQPYSSRGNSLAEATFILNLEITRVEIDVQGPREVVILANLVQQTNPNKNIWHLAVSVNASKSTTDEKLLNDCVNAIKKEMQSSGLIN